MLTDAIEKYGIYTDQKLKKYIYGLEKRFEAADEKEFFNELVNFSKNADIPYHSWFKYREGFSHTLIKELIKRCGIKRDEYILDPFCGSGTTVVEAALNGFSGIGIDINPMSAYISEIKCRSYTDEETIQIKIILSGLKEKLRSEKPDPEYIQKYSEVRKFFNNANFERLIAIRQVLDKNKAIWGTKIYELFLCAYICITEDVSDRKRDGNGLKTLKTKVADVESFFVEKLDKMTDDITKNRIRPDVVSVLAFGDAMQLSETVEKYHDVIGKKLGAIIYSPPYANSFDYFESYKMEVILADYSQNMKGIAEYRQKAVESFVGRTDERNSVREEIEWMAGEIAAAIPEKEARTGKRDARTRRVPKMLKGYFTDMEKVICESSKVLDKGRKCCIVVDQSAYLGKIVPTDLFLAAIAEEYDFTVKKIIICRTAKTSGQQIQLYPYLRDSLRESIVVLEKK